MMARKRLKRGIVVRVVPRSKGGGRDAAHPCSHLPADDHRRKVVEVLGEVWASICQKRANASGTGQEKEESP